MNEEEKKKAAKLWLIVVGVCILTVAVFCVLYRRDTYVETWNGSESSSSKLESGDKKILFEASESNGGIGDHVRGKVDSSVVFVEYADMQCPGCASAISMVDELADEYGDRVAFVFRHYMISGHANARSAAAAVESAGLQGHYWDMIDAMYAMRGAWVSLSGDELTEEYVSIFKLVAEDGDVDEFRSKLTDENVLKKVDSDYKYGQKTDKVSATPSFYINGVAIDIDEIQTWDDLREVLRSALDAALEANAGK